MLVSLAHGAFAAVLTAVLVAGCTSTSDEPRRPAEPPQAQPTPLDDYDTTTITVARSPFCDRLSQQAVANALSVGADTAAQAETGEWQPGRRLPGTSSVGNEYGCSWTSGSTTAKAWVFAPPVTSTRAEHFAAETVQMKCQKLPAAPRLGRPTVAQRCGLNTGQHLIGIHGLVGDAWVGCEISGTSDVRRTSEWCVEVLEALRA